MTKQSRNRKQLEQPGAGSNGDGLDHSEAHLASRQPAAGGTVTGWRVINGVTVFDVAAHSGLVEPQQFVRYADYLAAVTPTPVAVPVTSPGWVLVPQHFQITAEDWEAAAFHFGGPGVTEDENYLGSTAWIGEIANENDERKTYGLHISCNECPEEGSITLAELAAHPHQLAEADPMAANWLPIATAPADTKLICAWAGAPGCSEVDVAVYHTRGTEPPYWCSPHDANDRFSEPHLYQALPTISDDEAAALLGTSEPATKPSP
ncbi:hypothetical protein [Xanthomonas euvesicatoria]|uniref:hypothetical protein n=1 Tax=Xanthomonas euvesicatoria TaxID=456327 RepID=UPI001E64D108|nr:hypothetical protein [Xanthomonas euvesicatoria]MCC8614620.1 hypothetical protein [Xanthomonas euvesicatoria pv. euvesicatoria]